SVGDQASAATGAVYQQGARAGEYLTRNVNRHPLTALLVAGTIGYLTAYLIHPRQPSDLANRGTTDQYPRRDHRPKRPRPPPANGLESPSSCGRRGHVAAVHWRRRRAPIGAAVDLARHPGVGAGLRLDRPGGRCASWRDGAGHGRRDEL